MSKHTKGLELGFHHALPGWCKIFGLKTRPIPECEGGGVMIEEARARSIVDCVNALEGFADPSAAADLLEAAKDFVFQAEYLINLAKKDGGVISIYFPAELQDGLAATKQAIAKAEGSGE